MWYPARASHSAATTVRRWPAAVSRPAQSGVRCLRAGSARANKPALRLLRTAAARRNLTCAVSKEEGDNGPVQLATAALGPTVDTARLLGLLRGWANSFSSQSTNPLQLSLMVDSIQGGVRMTLIEVVVPALYPCDVLCGSSWRVPLIVALCPHVR